MRLPLSVPLAIPFAILLAVAGPLRAGEADPAPPPMQLAEVHHLGDPLDLPGYRVSEKYDGVRAWWDGHRLISRQGKVVVAPAWFVAGWPERIMDGEIWGGRGRFEATAGTLNRKHVDDGAWRQLRYMIFDLPDAAGDFDARRRELQSVVGALGQPWVQAVEQARLADSAALARRLAAVVAGGGEGLMLRRADAPYSAGRSRDLLKLKPRDDAEAVVIAHLPGRGKYAGLTGALLVERPDGLRFGLGSGLTDAQRLQPPPIGTTVTYAYTGFTEAGAPRFARFLRVRAEP